MLEKFLNRTISVLLLSVPLVFLYISSDLIFPYITGKNFLFRSIIEVALFLYLILIYLNKDFLPKYKKLTFAYIVFMLLLLVSNIFGSNFFNSFFSGFERMEGYITHIHLFIYFVLLSSIFRSKEEWKKVFAVVFLVSIPILIYGFLQLFGQRLFFNNLSNTGEQVVKLLNMFYPTGQGNGLRIDSTFGNSAYSAIFFVFIFLMSTMKSLILNNFHTTKYLYKSMIMFFGLTLSTFFIITENLLALLIVKILNQNIWLNILYLLVLLSYFAFIYFAYRFIKLSYENEVSSYFYVVLSFMSIVMLYYTQTRGSYIALLFAIIFILIALYTNKDYFKSRIIKNVIKIKLYSFILFFISLLFLIGFYSDSQLVKNNLFLNRISTINLNVFSPYQIYYSIKNDTYEEMLNRFGEATLASRVMNIGMSLSFSTDSIKNFLIGNGQENYIYIFSQYHDSRMYSQEPWFDRAHNVLFDWLTAAGVFGLIAYLSLFVISFKSIIKNSKVDIIERYFLSGILIAYFIHNLFVFDNITSYIMFVMILSYISSLDDESVIIKNKKFLYLVEKIKYYSALLCNNIYFIIFILLSLVLIFYNLVLSQVFAAYRTYDFIKYSDIYSKSPDRNNLYKVLSSSDYIIKNMNYGYVDFLAILLNTTPKILSVNGISNEEILNNNIDYLNFIHINFIPKIVSLYNDEKSYLMIATFYDYAGQTDLARYYFEKSESVGGKKPLSKLQYSVFLYKYNKKEEALLKAEQALSLDDSNPRVKALIDIIKQDIESHK